MRRPGDPMAPLVRDPAAVRPGEQPRPEREPPGRVGTVVLRGVLTVWVGYAVVAVWLLVLWALEPVQWERATPVVLVVGVVSAVGLAVGGWRHVRALLLEGEGVAAGRDVALALPAAVYLVLAGVVAAVPVEASVTAVALGALAMTGPGVALVVLDGSPPLRAVLRVLLAAALTAPAGFVGFWAGYVGFFVVPVVGSVLLGFLVGHLLTFVPLALVGPGPRVTGGAPRGR